jgi:hypothetical protein
MALLSVPFGFDTVISLIPHCMLNSVYPPPAAILAVVYALGDTYMVILASFRFQYAAADG